MCGGICAQCRLGEKQVPMSMFAFEHTEGITLISEYVKIIMRNQLKSTVSSFCLVSNIYVDIQHRNEIAEEPIWGRRNMNVYCLLMD